MPNWWAVGENLALRLGRTWPVWALASFLLILFLYLLHRRWRTVEVSSHVLWLRIIHANERRSAWRRLHSLLSLLLWLLAVAAATGAAMGPGFVERYEPENLIFVVDNSLSASVADVEGRPRLEAARAAVRGYVDAAHPAARFALCETAPAGRLIATWSDDRADFFQSLGGLETAFAPGRLSAAVDLARRACQDIENTRVVILTDGAEAIAPKEGETLVVCSGGAENVGIDDLRISRDPYYLNFTGVARLRNFGTAEGSFKVLVAIEKEQLTETAVTVAAGATADVEFAVPWGKRGVLRAEVLNENGDVADVFSWDNAAEAYLVGQRLPRVVLVEAEKGASLLLPGLLSLRDYLKLDAPLLATPESFGGLADDLTESDLVIFDNCAPAAPLSPGNYLMIASRGEHVPFDIGEWMQPEALAIERAEHPIVRFLTLDRIVARRVLRVAPEEGQRAFLMAGNSPVMFAWGREGVNVVYVGFDLAESNFILLDSFPMFLANLVRECSRQYRTLFEQLYWTGAVLEPDAAFTKPVKLIRYLGEERREEWTLRPNAEQRVLFTDTVRPGRYYLQEDDTVFSPACVNFRMPAEAVIGPRLEGAMLSPPQVPERPWLVGQPVARWLILFAAACLLLEWILFAKTGAR